MNEGDKSRNSGISRDYHVISSDRSIHAWIEIKQAVSTSNKKIGIRTSIVRAMIDNHWTWVVRWKFDQQEMEMEMEEWKNQ